MEVFHVLIDALWQLMNIHIHIDNFEIKLYYLPLFIWFVLTILRMLYGPVMQLTGQHIEERSKRERTKALGRDMVKNWGRKDIEVKK